MKEIRNNIIPFPGFKAINLFGLLFVRTGATMSDQDYNHEAIHTAQMQELGYVGFYILYLLEWLRHLASGMNSNDAYHAISFEREAYGHQSEPDYLQTRSHWAQWG